MYILGQILGIVAIILGFLTYQMRTRERLVFVQIATTLCFCVHYFLIGAYSGMALNAVAMIRNIVYYFTGKNGAVSRVWAVTFAVCMGAMGVLSWQAWYSVFVVIGLIINSYCMSFSNPQNIRKSILVTSPLVLIYNIIVHSFGGAVYESVAIISSFIGVLRHKNNKKP